MLLIHVVTWIGWQFGCLHDRFPITWHSHHSSLIWDMRTARVGSFPIRQRLQLLSTIFASLIDFDFRGTATGYYWLLPLELVAWFPYKGHVIHFITFRTELDGLCCDFLSELAHAEGVATVLVRLLVVMDGVSIRVVCNCAAYVIKLVLVRRKWVLGAWNFD